MEPRRLDRRTFCAGAAFIVVALGLLLRSKYVTAPLFARKYGADALWALLVFLLIAIVAGRWKPAGIAIAAFVFSCAVEFSQLYHAPWIDSIRSTTPGALVLGSVFNWPDIPAYAAGVVAGFLGLAWYSKR